MGALLNLIFGRPLALAEERGERVGPLRGVSILGLDALASAAYGPEALLSVLLPLGAGAVDHVMGVTLVIVGLLVIVCLSYWQTIAAYPNGGGSYTVAKENLGKWPSIVAAAALSVDYVLNVSVAISAGVGALVSAVPSLLPFTLWLCLGLLALLTLVNLRGVRATGAALAIPTYAFIGSLALVLVAGCAKAIASAGHPAPTVAPPHPVHATEGITAWLLVRAFANGCTAMTGVEAVSNGIPIFRPPSERGAQRTLAIIIGALTALLIGIAFVARAFGVAATPPGQRGYESILSQITGAVVGRGWLYGLIIASVVSVLALSANTSFADFPRLCRLLAQDGFLPEPFAHRGRRLAYSHGIAVLATVSAVLLAAFRGVTDALIPLFAFGAFVAFTASQAGMVEHWRKRPGNGRKLALNAVGASFTGAASVVILVSKFVQGAWASLLLVAAAVASLAVIRRHSDYLLRATGFSAPLAIDSTCPPIAVVPMRRWDAASAEALGFAMQMAEEVIVAQVLTGDRQVDNLRERWSRLAEQPATARGRAPPRLRVLESEYRYLLRPLIAFIGRLLREHPDRRVVVVVPQLVDRAWYGLLVDPHTATILRESLVFEGKPHLVVVTVPYYV